MPFGTTSLPRHQGTGVSAALLELVSLLFYCFIYTQAPPDWCQHACRKIQAMSYLISYCQLQTEKNAEIANQPYVDSRPLQTSAGVNSYSSLVGSVGLCGAHWCILCIINQRECPLSPRRGLREFGILGQR